MTSDRYVVSSGCRRGDTVAIREHFGMTADGGVVMIGTCFGAPVEPVEPVELMTVRGTVRQPGNVFIAGQWRSGSTSDWEFEHTIPRDTYDVLAVEALQRPSSVLLRRGLAASTEIVEPPLDFTTEGLPMTVAVPSITGLDAADRVSTDTVLELGGHIAVVAVLIADVAHLVPAAVRGDATQHVTVAAFRDEGPGQSFLRLETRAVEGDQVEVELLPELRAVTFEPAGLGARWDAVEVPGVTGVTLNLTSSGVSQAITASPAWLATSDYLLAPDVTRLPRTVGSSRSCRCGGASTPRSTPTRATAPPS